MSFKELHIIRIRIFTDSRMVRTVQEPSSVVPTLGHLLMSLKRLVLAMVRSLPTLQGC